MAASPDRHSSFPQKISNYLRVPIFLAKEDSAEVAYVYMRASGTRCWKQQNEQSKAGKIRCLEVWLGRSRLD